MPEESTVQANDERLLAAVARGETNAFAALYDRLSGPLYALCLRMTGEAQEAEDILQGGVRNHLAAGGFLRRRAFQRLQLGGPPDPLQSH